MNDVSRIFQVVALLVLIVFIITFLGPVLLFIILGVFVFRTALYYVDNKKKILDSKNGHPKNPGSPKKPKIIDVDYTEIS